MLKKKYTDDEMKNILKLNGYNYLEGKYGNCKSKLKCSTKEGYIVFVVLDKLFNRNSVPRLFHPSNPYSTYNIKLFLENNPKYLCTYDSGSYINTDSILTFRCKCGNKFSTKFDNVRSLHKNKCDTCSGYSGNLTYENVKENLAKHGFYLCVKEGDYVGITTTDLMCKDADGYKYKVKYDAIIRGKYPLPVHTSNSYTIENINLFLLKHVNDEYKCISNKYVSNSSLLKFVHKKCNHTFTNKWVNIMRCGGDSSLNKIRLSCPYCNVNQIESSHATVLKQIWIREEGTSIEDRSCINPNTGFALPTDIVNHSLKVAIEIQSWFHDFDKQKIKDKIKKEYWINRGYNFYAVDQRDYTILEMIQLFFPNITQIPSYIDFTRGQKLNDVKAQRLLNDGHDVVQCSKLLNCSTHQIYDAIGAGRITYPDNYINKSKCPVVQLDLEEKYISRYNSIKEAGDSNNIKPDNISASIMKNRYYSSGYIWIKEQDYKNGTYAIPVPKCKKKKKK